MISSSSLIELQKENMKFSTGHFTIFSETERENLHGHNYTVYLGIQTELKDRGLNFDYRYYKELIYKLCRELNQTTLIPSLSPHLTIDESDGYINVHFNEEVIKFLKRDVKLIELTNITVEELSRWFVRRMAEDETKLAEHHIQSFTVKVFSASGQSGSATWILSPNDA